MKHKVQRGDNWASLAQKYYGDRRAFAALLQANAGKFMLTEYVHMRPYALREGYIDEVEIPKVLAWTGGEIHRIGAEMDGE